MSNGHKIYKHLLYTNYANIKKNIDEFRKADKKKSARKKPQGSSLG